MQEKLQQNYKQLYKITKSNVQSFQQNRRQNWKAHVTQRENNNILKLFTFHIAKKEIKSLEGTPINSRNSDNSEQGKSNFLEMLF